MLENELTADHVKSVLKQAIGKFELAKEHDKHGDETANNHIAFMDVYAMMGAGLVFNMQLALAKLGCTFEQGIDGMYGSKDTTQRVIEFQNAWNASHEDDQIAVDGWAGQETLEKIVIAMDDPNWDPSLIGTAPDAETDTDTETEDANVEEEEITYLSLADAMQDPEKYHLIDTGTQLKPMF